MKRNTIYVAHRYGDRSHFQALYEKAGMYGYDVSEQIILANKAFCGKVGRCILKGKWKEAIGYIIIKIKFLFLRNEILIISLPPYDYTLIKYKKIIEKNKSYFHTSHPFWDGSNFPRGKIAYKKKFENILKSDFRGCFCVNTMAKKGLEPFIERREVIFHAINVDKYQHIIDMEKENTRNYVFVGRFEPIKNISLILQWMKQNPDVDMTMSFIGRGTLEESIRKAAIKDKRIILKGFYTKEQLQQELCQYDFLILPSSFEPLGIVLLEAFASAVPCLISNVAGPSDIVTHGRTGFVFDIKDGIDGFSKAMQQSLKIAKEDFLNMKKNALNEASKYDTETIVQKWMAMLEEDT